MKKTLSMKPKHMLYNKIDINDMEAEIGKGVMKASWSLMNKERDDTSDDDDENASEVFNIESKVMDYGKMRATTHPTVQRLIMPKPGNFQNEAIFQNHKDKLICKTIEYKQSKGNSKGWPQNSKTTENEAKMNDYLKQNNKMFNVGISHNHQDRVNRTSLSTNVAPPPSTIVHIKEGP